MYLKTHLLKTLETDTVYVFLFTENALSSYISNKKYMHSADQLTGINC